MPDHLLHELAEDAPPLRAGFADDILSAVRRRTRRNRGILATVAATAVVAIAVPVAVALSGSGSADPAPSPGALGSSTTGSTRGTSFSSTTPVPAPASTDAEIYAAGLRYALGQPAGPDRPRVLLVRAATCADVPHGGIGPCRPQAIASDVQVQVTRLIGSAADVRWGDTFRVPSPKHPGLEAVQAEQITFSPIQHDGARRAVVWVEQVCGFNCVLGAQLQLTETGGTWRVTGGGGFYIS